MSETHVTWNNDVELILADVDQTVCDDFVPAEPEMVAEIDGLLDEGKSIVFVTGGPLLRLRPRLLDQLSPRNRHRVVAAHCSGAEVWGFDKDGTVHDEPFYSVYDHIMTEGQKRQWRDIVDDLLKEFALEAHPVTPLEQFRAQYGNDPFHIILEDRGPQITLEVVNGYDLDDEQRALVAKRLPQHADVVDLREPIAAWVTERLQAAGVPVTPRLAGVFAVDLALAGVSKTEAVRRILSSPHILQHIGQGSLDLSDPNKLEVWGDRFDQQRGTDWLISAAVDPAVRSIDFRDEDPAGFPPELPNIVVWGGQHKLEKGALEYLQGRRK